MAPMQTFFALLERDVRERDALPFFLAPENAKKKGGCAPGSVIIMEADPHGDDGRGVLHGIRLLSADVGTLVTIDATSIAEYARHVYCDPVTMDPVPGLWIDGAYYPTILAFMTLSMYATARNRRPWVEAGCVPRACVWRRELPTIVSSTRRTRGLAAEQVEAARALQRLAGEVC